MELYKYYKFGWDYLVRNSKNSADQMRVSFEDFKEMFDLIDTEYCIFKPNTPSV